MNNDMKLLTNYQLFDYTPDMIKESKDLHDGKIILRGILQKADVLNQNGRIYTRAVLAREVRNYQKFIVENRALGECVPPGTEIYTRDGWKNIEDIDEKEVIFTLNVKTNEVELQRINRKIELPFDGELLRFRNSSSFDMCLTPGHVIQAWDRNNNPVTLTAQELFDAYERKDSVISHYGIRRAGGTWSGERPGSFSFTDGVTVDIEYWAAFLGIYLAEGHSSGVYANHRQKQHNVVITQNDGEACDAIRDLLNKMPWKFEEVSKNNSSRRDFVIVNEALHSQLLQLGGSREKHVPLYTKQWDVTLQEIMLEWMLLGDGRHRHGRKNELISEYCTSSTKLANDVAEIMFKMGYGATIHQFDPVDKPAPDFSTTGRMILAENQVPMNIVYQHMSKAMSLDFRFLRVEKNRYKGNVYCVNVQNGTWLMRYNGKVCWTHNCDHPDSSVVELKNVSHVVREAVMGSDGVVTGSIELLPTPNGLILKALVESGIKIGISSRGVGSTKKEGDYFIVQDDFQLICWDVVSEPSTSGAFMLPEGKQLTSTQLKQIFKKSDRIDRIVNELIF